LKEEIRKRISTLIIHFSSFIIHYSLFLYNETVFFIIRTKRE